jgi:2-oxoisovalerate dehydrogenase E1 component beta subunit
LEPKALYRGAEEEVPTQDYELDLHVADVMQKGTDITLIGWGAQLRVIKEVIISEYIKGFI